nr:hypothetical protein CFP56_24780 [Quercus suber]
MAELVHSDQNFMNVEDAIIAKKRKRVEKVEANTMRQSEQSPRPKKGRTEDKRDREKKAGPSARNQHPHCVLYLKLLDIFVLCIGRSSGNIWTTTL